MANGCRAEMLSCDSRLISAHLEDIRNGFKQFHELGEPIVGELALAAKVVVISGDELAEGHAEVWLVPQKINHLFPKLSGALRLLRGPL